MTIYLYHKRHLTTHLNYFGKTINNPLLYNGSGIRWSHHLKKHGALVETVYIWEFDNVDDCTKFAIDFSIQNNIVNSREWANLCIEDGKMGGDKFKDMDPDRREQVRTLKSFQTAQQWKTRDKNSHSKNVSSQWRNRDKETSQQIFRKISQTLLAKTKDQIEETLSKRRLTEQKRTFTVCPHCGLKSKNASNMKRYHFDYCPRNPTALPRPTIAKKHCEFCNKLIDPGNYKKLHGEQCRFKPSC